MISVGVETGGRVCFAASLLAGRLFAASLFPIGLKVAMVVEVAPAAASVVELGIGVGVGAAEDNSENNVHAVSRGRESLKLPGEETTGKSAECVPSGLKLGLRPGVSLGLRPGTTSSDGSASARGVGGGADDVASAVAPAAAGVGNSGELVNCAARLGNDGAAPVVRFSVAGAEFGEFELAAIASAEPLAPFQPPGFPEGAVTSPVKLDARSVAD